MKTRIEDYCVWLPFNGFPLMASLWTFNSPKKGYPLHTTDPKG